MRSVEVSAEAYIFSISDFLINFSIILRMTKNTENVIELESYFALEFIE